jgi:chromosome partitioning protein
MAALLPELNPSCSLAEIGEFSDVLNKMMGDLRLKMLAPKPRKNAPTFSTSQVCQLCGIDRARLNYLISKKGSTLPGGVIQSNGRNRSFTLTEARAWIKEEAGITPKPTEALGEIIICSNFKGGSTKTTTAMSLAQGLTLRGRKVLIVDLDPQASLTELAGIYAERDVDENHTVMPLIYQEEPDLRYAVQETYWDGLSVIPAAPALFSAEFVIPSYVNENPKFRFWDLLGNGLRPLRNEFDYIVIDTAPSLSYLTINALMSANAMIMPLVPESLDFVSSVHFWNLFSDLAKTFAGMDPNKRFDFISVLLSKVDYSQTSSAPVVRSWAQRAYPNWILPIEIPSSSAASSEALEASTVYDVDTWEGSYRTLQRIREPLDALCKLVDDRFVVKWSQGK